jgi:hypothetical protein
MNRTDSTPDSVLVTVESRSGAPSLRTAARQLGVRVKDLDAEFGVILVDPGQGLYSVQVNADRLPAGFEKRSPYRGPYANPSIASFGPMKDEPTARA